MGNTNDVISWLFRDAADLCVRFKGVDAQVQALSDDDPRRYGLGIELEELRARIMKRFGVLGTHFPNVGPELASALFRDRIDSLEYRKYLTVEDVLAALLEGQRGEATVQDYWAFVNFLDIHELPTDAEALGAVASADPARFEIRRDGDMRFYRLKAVD